MLDTKSVLRLGMRRLAASVCVISTKADGRRYAMTASSVTSVSDDPSSLLVCVNREASICPVLALGQPFVINLLSDHQQDVSSLCAGKKEGEERFSQGNWRCSDSGLPYLEGAQVSFFCHVDNDNYQYGTHQIVVGRLDSAVVSDAPVSPLVYLDGSYRQLS